MRRLVLVTGARQTGKTTSACRRYPALRYLNLDSLEDRISLRELRTRDWARTVGAAILDEAQKEPSVFEKVKFAFDAGEVAFSVLLGSSRVLLLDRVRESLAGRIFVHDCWPLVASELRAAWTGSLRPPLLAVLLGGPGPVSEELLAVPPLLLGDEDAAARGPLEHLATWGGMPGLLPLGPEDRRHWLTSYQQTFLERDLADLASLRDLLPFRNLQQVAMARTGQVLSYASLAQDAGLPASTARRYLEYLTLTDQVILLRPWLGNLTSRVVKAPKLYWMDLGTLRSTTRQWGDLTGALMETLVVSEIWKWVRTTMTDVGLWFYRTRSGLEVDLLVEAPSGILGIEIKAGPRLRGSDTRNLRAVADALGTRWRGGLVIYRGNAIERLDPARSIFAVPLHRLV